MVKILKQIQQYGSARGLQRTCWIPVVILLFCAGFPAAAQTITVTGQWDLTINSTNLQAGPGSNLVATYQSAANQVIANINPRSFGKTWLVQVHKTDILWNSNLHLDIRRQAYSNLVGGLTYFEITNIDQDFFWSDTRKGTNGVQIQFQLRGVSVDIPVNNYSTTVYYTLIDT
jgi:hypothetical protein